MPVMVHAAGGEEEEEAQAPSGKDSIRDQEVLPDPGGVGCLALLQDVSSLVNGWQ